MKREKYLTNLELSFKKQNKVFIKRSWIINIINMGQHSSKSSRSTDFILPSLNNLFHAERGRRRRGAEYYFRTCGTTIPIPGSIPTEDLPDVVRIIHDLKDKTRIIKNELVRMAIW